MKAKQFIARISTPILFGLFVKLKILSKISCSAIFVAACDWKLFKINGLIQIHTWSILKYHVGVNG